MELKFIKKEKLNYLKANFENNTNLGKYYENDIWIDIYLGEEFSATTGIFIDDIDLALPVDGDKKITDNDLENCKKIYLAMKDITIQEATEEQIWVYLTHVTFWDYMRKRWPIKDKKSNSIEDKKLYNSEKGRYFFQGNPDRALTRNGISRLWWIAYSTYDETFKDPFHLTKLLFIDQDFIATIFERNFSRNSNVTKYILKAIDKYSNEKSFPKRSYRRALGKEINRIGAVRILDMLSYDEIESIVYKSFAYYEEIGLK